MHCPPPPDSIMKKRTKLPRMEDHTDPPARLDTDKEYNNREQKLPIPIQTTPPPEATWGKYTKSFKKLVKQYPQGHYTGNKYDLPRKTHLDNTRAQGTRM